jgi:hypothetical protein
MRQVGKGASGADGREVVKLVLETLLVVGTLIVAFAALTQLWR